MTHLETEPSNHQELAEFLNEFSASHLLYGYAHYFLVREKLDRGEYVFDATMLPDIVWAFQDFSSEWVFRWVSEKVVIFLNVMRSYGWRTWGETHPLCAELPEAAIQCVSAGIREYARTEIQSKNRPHASAVVDNAATRGVNVLNRDRIYCDDEFS